MIHKKLLPFLLFLPLSALASATGVEQSLLNQHAQDRREFIQQIQEQKEQFAKSDSDEIMEFDLADWQEESPCFVINEFELVVSDKSLSDRFSFVLKPLIKSNEPSFAKGRCIGSHNLQNIILITQNELLKHGYITSQIHIPNQDLSQGKLILELNAGKMGGYTQPVKPFVRGAIPLKEDEAFNLRKLEQGLENLKRIDPTTNIAIVPDNERIGYSKLDINMGKTYAFGGSLGVDNSLQKHYGTYLLSMSATATNPLGLGDDWRISANYPLKRLIDKYNGKNNPEAGKDRQLNYQAQLSLPYGNYKVVATHGHHQYKHYVAGFNNPLLYHGQSTTSTLGLTRLISRNHSYKTEIYIKGYHKQSKHFIDDIEIKVQNRRTSGYHLGISHQHQLDDRAFIYANLDYRHGTAMLNAKPAPEEEIYNAFGERLPAEGYARSPLWSWYVEYNKPWQVGKQNLQYNAKFQGQYANKLPISGDLYYLGGRYSVRGFKEGNYLAAEHGLNLQQELSWRLPHTSNKQYTQSYVVLDQGFVTGQYSQTNARQLMSMAIGVRHHYQHFGVDAFIGRGLVAPKFIPKETVVGISADYRF